MSTRSDQALLETICERLEEAMKRAGVSVDDLRHQAMIERAKIVERRYLGPKRGSQNKPRRPARKSRD